MTEPDPVDRPAKFQKNGIVIERLPIRAAMRDATIVHGYVYQRDGQAKKSKNVTSETPLLCLPTELGNSREYHPFAIEIMGLPGAPKKLFTVDLRGRGRSHAKNISTSSTVTDADDLISFCDTMGLHNFDLLVSGRSAISVCLTAPQRPSMIRRLVLNDSGTHFDSVEIARQTALRQRQSPPSNWEEAVLNLKQLKQTDFPSLAEDQWLGMAQAIWSEKDGVLTADVQGDLERYTNSASYDVKQPDMAPEWKILHSLPTLLVRGEHSSLLTAKIAAQMVKSHPKLRLTVAKDQGHVPLLHLNDLPKTILSFLRDNEQDM